MNNEPADMATGELAGSRYERLVSRARRGGYYMASEPLPPYRWILHDVADGAPIVSMHTLDEVEQWLDT
ncbi:hypothetical protein DFR68_104315 [Nocardia mexicana]|uniref:Uncharacterized protein n=1 Tax=Nocardia mexicana TaxID=279262 RepID=A0A370H6V0_9NOCA|nr:hypothetical protein DFR68_104315 [Nocardia mexicana]